MKATLITALTLALGLVAVPASADRDNSNRCSGWSCNTYDNDTYNNQSYDYDVNSNYNLNSSEANADADATGIGVGIGMGGTSAADASVGDVTVGGANVYSSNRNTVEGGRNDQDQSQGQTSRNNVSATGSGNDTTVTVEGDTIPVQKKPDVPSIAPSVTTGSPTAPCYIPVGASGAYGGLVSIGGSGAIKDHGCALGEVVRRAVDVGNTELANVALRLMFEIVVTEAGLVEPKQDETGATFSEPTHPTDDVLYFAR